MIRNKLSSSKKRIFLLISVSMLFSCTNNKFESSKLDFVSKASVFGNENLGKTVDVIPPDVAIDVNVSAKTGPILLSVMLRCSTSGSAQGGNLLANSDAEIEINDPAGKSVCKITSTDYDIIDFITKNKKVDLVKCRENLKDSVSYKISINSLDQQKKFVKSVGSGAIVLKDGQIQTGTSAIVVLFNYNFKTKPPTDPNIANNNKFTSQADRCDQHASPLVIDMRSDLQTPRGIELTSLVDGVRFDIFGKRATPHPHAKTQISWITNSKYMFLVRPNNRGEVNGIDELFGDNTAGPDGRFASDGFAALAKFDSNQDKVIDKKDKVFNELRLWSDLNLDGITQKHELISLAEVELTEIDLAYDPSFKEVDQYGNETKLKSVVRFSNGELRLVFDLWFRFNLED